MNTTPRFAGADNGPGPFCKGLQAARQYLFAGIMLAILCSLAGSAFAQGESDESGDEIRAREEFLHTRRAGGPGKVIPAGAYEAALQQSSRVRRDRDIPGSPTASTDWISVNPTGMFYNRTGANYISGRTNCFAFDPTDPNTFYIAAAGGGVWKTIDGGAHFNSVTDDLSALTSGAVAVDPNNPDVVYVATGELNYSGDSYFGNGIFKSTDGGSTWNQSATTAAGSYFSAIIVDPANSANVYAAGSNGVYKSTNAGASWSTTNSNTYANSLVMDPVNTQVLYVSTGVGWDSLNLVRKTTNGGATWTTLAGGLPASNNERTALAISANNPSVVYASVGRYDNDQLLGLYRTTDAGATWTLQNSTTNYLGSQAWYDNTVAVNPANPDFVVVGGLDIYTSTDGGVTFTQRTSWYTTTASNMSHADIHYLGYNGTVLYCGSDGGAYQSTDDGVTWSDMNLTLSTLQYQSADYDPTNLLIMHGGCQDNNKQYTTNGGTSWIQRTTGDGGYTVIDPVNTNYIYGSYVNGSIQRSSNSGLSYTEIRPNGSKGGLFYDPYEMAPGDHNTIVFGRSEVWKTASAQTATSSSGWTQIADSLTISGKVSAIGISAATTDKIYIGTSNGKIFVTTDNGGTWSSTTGYPYVSDLAVDPTDDAVAYATFGGFTAARHVYKTTNSGLSWFSVTADLPNIPCLSIILKTSSPRTIFVGTDLGVYKSTDDGGSWIAFNNGMPAVEVYDLKHHPSTSTILAATHGRGCFTFTMPSGPVYTITSSAGAHGSITPSGAVTVVQGEDRTFTITPATGYHTDSVTVDGIRVDSTTTYTFVGVTAPHTIDAQFAINRYTLTVSAAAHGTARWSGLACGKQGSLCSSDPAVTLNYGESETVELTPDPGYRVADLSINGAHVDSTTSCLFTNITADQTIAASFAVAPAYAATYRTFLPEEIGKDRDNKGKPGKFVQKKPDKVEFVVSAACDSGNISGMHIEFGAAIDTAGDKLAVAAPLDSATVTTTDPKLKKWDVAFSSPIGAVEYVTLHGYAWSTREQKVIKYWWTRAGVQVGATKKTVGGSASQPRLPMPNRINVLAEAVAGFGPAGGGFTIGENRKNAPIDSSKRYGWLQTTRYADLVKTLYTPKFDRINIGIARGFDHLTGKTADMTGKQASLPPEKFDNRLLAELIALKLNATAIAMRLTPPGLGELVYNDGTPNVLNGKSVWEITRYGDSVMMGQFDAGAGKRVFAPQPVFENLCATARYIDSAFSGPVDTDHFADSLRLTGVRRLLDVPRLMPNSAAVPSREMVSLAIGDENPYAEPAAYALYQNYPNPFNPSTVIEFDLPGGALVSLTVFNTLGQEVARLIDHEPMEQGKQEVEFDAAGLPSGVYFYRLISQAIADDDAGEDAGGTPPPNAVPFRSQVRKMLLLR